MKQIFAPQKLKQNYNAEDQHSRPQHRKI